MKTHRLAVALGMGAPLTFGKHFTLVVLIDQYVTVHPGRRALVMHYAEVGRIEKVFPLKHLHVTTIRTRHVVVTLVTAIEQVGYSRSALDRRRAGKVELGIATEGAAPGFRQLDGIAFLADVHLPAVDLVAVHIARRQLRQVGRRASSGDVQRPTLELFGVHGVARVPRTAGRDALAQHRRRLDGFADPRRHPLGQAQAGQQCQDVRRCHVHQAADPVETDLGFHQLRRDHGDHAFAGVSRRQATHGLAGIRCARGTVLAGLSGAGVTRDPHVLIGPLIDPDIRVGPQPTEIRLAVHLCTVRNVRGHRSTRSQCVFKVR
ncbi:hypothetical protein D3C85_899960 [compost metagenome]